MTNNIRLHEAAYEELRLVYGGAQAADVLTRIERLIADFPVQPASSELALSERDALIIAYGDHVQREGEAPLATLRDVIKRLALPTSGLHILPFYPYSSDDGFSVIDYKAVDPALGTWADVRALSADFRTMFDAVFNHISAHSAWFQAFLRGEAPYTGYFITVDSSVDLAQVTRPRALPLLTPFETANGRKHVWTTFSDDQIDLNAANPDVLLALLGVLLFYVAQGAQFIRLDAIAFLWKEIGTTCVHLPQTHALIQVMRDVLDVVAPGTILITETNVPQRENLSYFGDGANEAQLVYQFPLPPLILHTLQTGDARRLSDWALSVRRVSERTTFFNFTASHDGIGLRPASGILSDEEISALVERTLAQGGFVSYRSNSDGTQSPYEMNITYFDAITPPSVTERDPQTAMDRFIVSQAIMLAFVGMPGIYLPSLFGLHNDREGAAKTGRYRSINREKLDADALLAQLADPATLPARVFARYKRLLEARAAEPAFHPLGTQRVLSLDERVFALERTSPDGDKLLALHNVSGNHVAVTLPASGINRFDGQRYTGDLTLTPYQVLWLALEG
ncbi:MAG: sugar phosphorylase [Chloroflexota bacterium]